MDNINAIKAKYRELFKTDVAIIEINGATCVVPHCKDVDEIIKC